jgi:hypothetical protein
MLHPGWNGGSVLVSPTAVARKPGLTGPAARGTYGGMTAICIICGIIIS